MNCAKYEKKILLPVCIYFSYLYNRTRYKSLVHLGAKTYLELSEEG